MGNRLAKTPWYNDLKTTSALGNGTFVRIKAGLDTAVLEKRIGLSWYSETMDELVGKIGMVFSGSSHDIYDSTVDDKAVVSIVGFGADVEDCEAGFNYRPFYFLNEWLDVVPQEDVEQELQDALQARLSTFTAKIEEIHAREEAAAENESDSDSDSDKSGSKKSGDSKTRVVGEDLLRMLKEQAREQKSKQKIQYARDHGPRSICRTHSNFVIDENPATGTERTLHELTVTVMRLTNQVAMLQDKIDRLCDNELLSGRGDSEY